MSQLISTKVVYTGGYRVILETEKGYFEHGLSVYRYRVCMYVSALYSPEVRSRKATYHEPDLEGAEQRVASLTRYMVYYRDGLLEPEDVERIDTYFEEP